MIESLNKINSDSKYADYLKKHSNNPYKISFHAFNLLKFLRKNCVCAETSRDNIRETIAPKFKDHSPSENSDN